MYLFFSAESLDTFIWDTVNHPISQSSVELQSFARVGQKNVTFLRSFVFFSKERNVLTFFCVLYKKNAAFFAFFYVLYKRMLRSLCSFTFFIKECGFLCILLRSLYISIYIYIFILKKERYVLRSFAKERNVLAFFYVLCKRTKRSLRSFTFFAKECCILCVLLRS